MEIYENIVKRFTEEGTIEYKTKLTEAAYHIPIQDEHIKKVDFIPGYFLSLGVGFGISDILFKDKVSSYSVWNIDKSEGTLDLAIAIIVMILVLIG